MVCGHQVQLSYIKHGLCTTAADFADFFISSQHNSFELLGITEQFSLRHTHEKYFIRL